MGDPGVPRDQVRLHGAAALNASQGGPGGPDGPESLLEALLDALERFDEPRGADRVYALASDRMRASMGDRASFERAFRNARYRPLIAAGERLVEGTERLGDAARATVIVRDAEGVTARYLVAMREQGSGERSGAWLLSGIIREGVDA